MFSQLIKVILLFSLVFNGCFPRFMSEYEFEKLKKKWEDCCETNFCYFNTCYAMEWRSSAWSAMRDRCQAEDDDDEWNYTVDIFRVERERDIEKLWKLFAKADGFKMYDEMPRARAVWTSGVSCPRKDPEGIIVSNRWTTNKKFPAWLESKVSNSVLRRDPRDRDCKFLAITPHPNFTEVKYEFRDEFEQHAAICEFMFPDNIDWSRFTTKATTTTTVTKKKTTMETTTVKTTATKVKTTGTTATTRTTKATTTTTPSTTTTPRATTSTTTTTTTSTSTTLSSSSTSTTTTLPPTTTNTRSVCEGRNAFGIDWPDTPGGSVANVSCPEGMKGFARWICDEATLKFIPERPYIQDCKHSWISDLEKEISEERDVSHISSKLANKTMCENMSHGDITALVTLSEKLILLFEKQVGNDKQITDDEAHKTFIAYSFTQSMVDSFSNILRDEIKDAWNDLPEIHRGTDASKILWLVSSVGKKLSCIRKSEDELQFTVVAKNINMQTFVLSTINEPKGKFLIFPHPNSSLSSESSIILPSNLTLKNFYSPCSKRYTAVGVLYNNVGNFLQDEFLYNSTTQLVSPVLSFSLDKSTNSIPLSKGEKVSLIFKHSVQLPSRDGDISNPHNSRCVFWNFSKGVYGKWDDNGCNLVFSNLTHTKCKCSHLTNFAVLMDINNVTGAGDEIQNLLTLVCCSVSSVALVATLICLASIRSLRCKRSIITGNLCLCLLIMNLMVLFALDKTKPEMLCKAMAGILQFWILSAFCWMLSEGYHLYQMVIVVFQQYSAPIFCYCAFSYGIPLIIVTISVAILSDDYGGPYLCWLSNKRGLMYSFVAPACVIMAINVVVFILTLRSASSIRIRNDQSFAKKIKGWVGGSASVLCVLGITWVLGLLYSTEKLFETSYLFTMCNGLQGVHIFIFHILLNDRVRSAIREACFCKKKRRKQNTLSGNRTISRCSMQTSLNNTAHINSSSPCYIPHAVASRSTSSRNSDASSQSSSQNGIHGDCKLRFKSRTIKAIHRKTVAHHTQSDRVSTKEKTSQFQKYRSKSIPLRPDILKIRNNVYPNIHPDSQVFRTHLT